MERTTSPNCGALINAIARIEDIVTRETDCLKLSLSPDLSAFNDQKARALLHFDRTLRLIDPDEAREYLSEELAALRKRLDDNRRLLAIHADAARRVTEIVAEAMIAGESDGTYQRYPERALAAS